MSIFNFRNVKFEPKDLNSILGGGLYQSSMNFRMKDRYPMVINWVYAHLLVFNISQITNFDTITMVLEIKKIRGTFQSSIKFSWSIISRKLFVLWRFWNNNQNQWFFYFYFFSKDRNQRFLDSKIFKELELTSFLKFK